MPNKVSYGHKGLAELSEWIEMCPNTIDPESDECLECEANHLYGPDSQFTFCEILKAIATRLNKLLIENLKPEERAAFEVAAHEDGQPAPPMHVEIATKGISPAANIKQTVGAKEQTGLKESMD